MKTHSRLIALLVVVLTVSLFVGSCQKPDDHYAIGDFMVTFGVVGNNNDPVNSLNLIHLDNGDQFIPLSVNSDLNDFKAGERVFINIAPLYDKEGSDKSKTIYGKINAIHEILYKNIVPLTTSNNDSLGHYSIMVRDSWISGDSILNIEFNYYTGGALHFINLADNGEGNGKDKPYILEFRHNARNDHQYYKVSGYVSFKLNSLKIPGQNKISLYIRYTDYEGRRIDLPHTYNY